MVSFSGKRQDRKREKFLYAHLKEELAKAGIRLDDKKVQNNNTLIQIINDIANNSIEQKKEAVVKEYILKPNKDVLNPRSTIVGSVGNICYVLKTDKPIRLDKKLQAEIDNKKGELTKKFDGYENIQSGISMAMNSLKKEATNEAYKKSAITHEIILYTELLDLVSKDSIYLRKLNRYSPEDIKDKLNSYLENIYSTRYLLDGLKYNIELHEEMGDQDEYNTFVAKNYSKVIDLWSKIIDKEDLNLEPQPIEIFEKTPSKDSIAEKLKKFEYLSEEDTENLIRMTAFIITKDTARNGLKKQFFNMVNDFENGL